MRLRHKKPLNSYAGQANCDSNQGHDQDFAKRTSLDKKMKINKPQQTAQQIRMYAQILCQFVNVANHDYRSYSSKFNVPTALPAPPALILDKTKSIDAEIVKKNISNFSKNSVVEVNSKQQQSLIHSDILINRITDPLPKKKPISKKHSATIKQPIANNQQSRSIRPTRNREPPVPIPPKKPPQETPRMSPAPPPPPPPPQEKINNQTFQTNHSNIEQIQQIQQQIQQQLFQSQVYAMSSGMIQMYPMMPQIVNYQRYLEQISKLNPLPAMQLNKFKEQVQSQPHLGVNIMPVKETSIPEKAPNLTYLSKNKYIPFSQLPFSLGKQQKPLESVQKKIVTQEFTIKDQTRTTKISVRIDKLLQKVGKPMSTNLKSLYHVAIAYQIHYCRMRQTEIEAVDDNELLSKLDPTSRAQMLKQSVKIEKKKKHSKEFLISNDSL